MTANLKRWDATGTDGADVANGDVTGLTVTKAGTGTVKYETSAGFARGNDIGAELNAPVDTDTANVLLTTTAAAAGCVQVYFQLKNPPASATALTFFDFRSSTANLIRAAVNSSRVLTCQNAAGAPAGGTLTAIAYTLALDTTYCLELDVDPGTTTSNGTGTFRLYDNTDTLLVSGTNVAGGNFGTTNPAAVRIGDSGTVAGQGGLKVWANQLAIDTAATIAAAVISKVAPNPSTVSLTPAAVTASAVAVTPTPQPVTISLTPAAVTVTARPLPPSGMVGLTPNVVTVTAQTVTAQATTYVADNFNSYTAGAVLGAPWITHPSATGTLTVQTPTGSVRATNSTTALWTHPNIADFADGTIEADIAFISGSGYTSGVCGRVASGALTFYCARMNNSGALELVKSVAGTVTSLGQYIVNLAVGATIHVGLRMSGSAIVATGNGVDRITVTDTSVTAAGRVGLRATGGSTTSAGLHFDNFAATAAVASAMPTTEISGYVIDTSCDFSEGDFAEGDIVMMTSGDLGKIDPTSTAGALYAAKWKTKATGAIPNETTSDYDATQTMSVVNGILRMRQRWVSGRGKAGAIKPLLSGSNPNGENYIAYPRIRVRYRKTATPATGSTAAGWGGIPIEMIGSSGDWAAGGGEYGLGEGSFVSDAQGGSPLGVWVRPSNHLPNPNTYAAFYRADTAGAPSGENDWHIGELRSEPGRMRVFIDGVVIYDDTANPPLDTDLFGLLSQNGKPGTPSAGTEGLMEWDWYVVSRYVGASLNLTTKTVTVAPVAVTPVPGAVTINLTPATVTVTSIAVTPVPGGPTVTPLTVTVTAVAVTPVPQPITVDLSPAAVTTSTVAVTATPGSVTVSLTPEIVTVSAVAVSSSGGMNLTPVTVSLFVPVNANPDVFTDYYLVGAYPVAIGGATLPPIPVTLTAVAVTPAPGVVSVTLTPATTTTSALPVDPQLVAPEQDLSLPDIDVVVTAVEVVPVPGLVTFSLTPVTVSLTATQVVPAPIGIATLTPRTVTVSAVAVTPVPSAVVVSATPKTVTVSAVAVTPIGLQVIGAVNPAIVTVSAVAVTPVTQPGVVSLTPAVVSAVAVVTNPLGQSGTVTLTPVTVVATAAPASPVGQPGAVALTSRTIAISAVAVAPVGQPGTVTLTPATVTTSPVTVAPVGQPGVVTSSRPTVTLTTLPVSVTPGVVTTPLQGIVDTVTAVPATPVGGGVVALQPKTATLTAVAVTPVSGQVSVALTPATVAVAAQLVGAQSRVDLTPAVVVLSAQTVTQTPGVVTITATPKTVTVSAVAVTPVPGVMFIDATPETVTLTPVAVTPIIQPVNVALIPVLVYVSPWAVEAFPQASIALTAAIVSVSVTALDVQAGQVTTTLTTASVNLTTLPLDPAGQPIFVTLTTASVTVTARPLSVIPSAVTVSLQTVTVLAAPVALIPGAPVGEPVLRMLTAVLRDHGRYDASMADHSNYEAVLT